MDSWLPGLAAKKAALDPRHPKCTARSYADRRLSRSTHRHANGLLLTAVGVRDAAGVKWESCRLPGENRSYCRVKIAVRSVADFGEDTPSWFPLNGESLFR
jgi:hypothetical protein